MLLKEVKKILVKHNMIEQNQNFLIGVSGGIDSIVLTHVIAKVIEEKKDKMIICHVNYLLRGCESDRDENFVGELAQRLKVKFESIRIDMPKLMKNSSGGSLQNMARKVRLDFFKENSKKHRAKSLFLGHNLNDLCETFLMRLFRGSGSQGLSSIDLITEIDDLKLFRPLLGFTRKEIEAYAGDQRIEFVEDSSNFEDKYDRNKIRHQFIPLIEKEINPNVMKTFLMVTDLIKMDELFFQETIELVKKNLVVESSEDKIILDLNVFRKLHLALKSRVVRSFIKELKGDLYNISYVNIIDILHIAESEEKRKVISLPYGMKAEKINLRLIFSSPQSSG